MATDQDERVRQRAYEIWEREGRPHGQGDAHWAMAVQEIRAEDGWVDDAADPAGPDSEVPVTAEKVSGEAKPATAAADPASEQPKEPEAAPKKAKRAAKPAAKPAAKSDATPPAKSSAKSPTKSPAKSKTAATGRKRKATDANERVEG